MHRRTFVIGLFTLAFAVAFGALASRPARAASDSWIASAGGLFSDGSNWGTGVMPSTNATFGIPGQYTVQFDVNATNQYLIVVNGDVSFNLGGNTYNTARQPYSKTWVEGPINNDVNLTITNGVLQANNTEIGGSPNTKGTVTVSGSGATFDTSFDLNIGSSGTGTLAIENGALAEASSTSIGALGGQGKIVFNNGTLATQSLAASFNDLEGTGTINTRGLVTDIDLVFDQTHGPQQQFILNQPNQAITVNLDLKPNGTIGAGFAGQGTLTIRDGVTVNTSYGILGNSAGSSGTAKIAGAGSTWDNVHVSIGLRGTGTMTVENGGKLYTAGSGTLGYDPGSTGSLSITGSNSSSIFTWLYVGRGGAGTATVAAGGLLASYLTELGGESGSNGIAVVTGAGSAWRSKDFYVGGDSLGSAGQGTVIVSDGGLVSAKSGMKIWRTGTLTGSGGTVQGNVVNNGRIAPGAPVGNLTIDGYLDNDGVLAFELAGPASYDQLLITGQTFLDGKLEVTLIGGYMPAAGSLFNILDWGSTTGTFDVLDLPALDGGKTWNTSQLYTAGVLTVTGAPIVPGDFDSDGDVDGADFVAWQTNFPKASFATLSQGDADSDGDVDGADFILWQTNFPSTPGPATVPEPSTLLLALLFSLPAASYALRRR
jgi:fibronectin-binding autotransporter adhesin